jgi:chaperonin GroES
MFSLWLRGETTMPVRPLHDQVVIKRLEAETQTASGIIIPDNAKEKPSEGEVIAVGPGKTLDNGQVRAPQVKAGDRILFRKFGGTDIKVNGQEFLMVREEDILAIIEQ